MTIGFLFQEAMASEFDKDYGLFIEAEEKVFLYLSRLFYDMMKINNVGSL